jgi:ComF family protein
MGDRLRAKFGASVRSAAEAVNLKSSYAVDGWLRRLSFALLPASCLLCGAPGQARRDLCGGCRADVLRNTCACPRCALPLARPEAACGRCLKRPPAFQAAWAPFVYAAPLAGLLTRFKFAGDLAAGRLLAELALDELPAGLDRPQALLPVPLHPRRLRERGYNQALELARPLARALALPLLPQALQRALETPAQSGLSALARRRNLRAAFRVAARRLPAHVALVDDVMTTGATARCGTN